MAKINNHASCVIIESDKSEEFLVGLYDETYPIECFRNAMNFIGGNYKKGDESPLGILLREINEELSSNQIYINHKEIGLKNLVRKWKPPRKIKLFAAEKDISLIKNEIILNITPYKDYLWLSPSFKDKIEFHSLDSVFISRIKQEIFELVRKNLIGGKSIKNEGSAAIYSLDDIKKGRVLCAWAVPCILSDYKRVKISNPYHVKIKSIGKPRNSISDYIKEFEYRVLGI